LRAASILLYDEKRAELFFASAAGSDPKQLAAIPVPIESSIAGQIFLENHPLIINNAQQDPRHYAQVGQQINFQTRTLLGVPMRIRSRVTGVLEALNKRSGEFTQADTDLLSGRYKLPSPFKMPPDPGASGMTRAQRADKMKSDLSP
jgi:GAF domain-containing protein